MISFDVDDINTPLKSLKKTQSISLDDSYDLFISYSHRDTDIANQIFEILTRLKPEWDIFIDHSGLHAGSAWQAKLYQSIGTYFLLFLYAALRRKM